MYNDTISYVDPPGSLRRLLECNKMHNRVIVSESHRCSSYARFLAEEQGCSISLALELGGTGTGSAKWMNSGTTGNFRANSVDSGEREYYPLYRLVSLSDDSPAINIRDPFDQDPPLPDARPPWL